MNNDILVHPKPHIHVKNLVWKHEYEAMDVSRFHYAKVYTFALSSFLQNDTHYAITKVSVTSPINQRTIGWWKNKNNVCKQSLSYILPSFSREV